MPKRSKKVVTATEEVTSAEEYKLYMNRVFAALASATGFRWDVECHWVEGYVKVDPGWGNPDKSSVICLNGTTEAWELDILENTIVAEMQKRAEAAAKEARKQEVLNKLTAEEREVLGFK